MILIVCLDDRDGMTFLGRRQSQDRLLRSRVLQLTGGSLLWMNAYSAGQFTEPADHLRVSQSPLTDAGAGEYCFAENVELAGVRPEKLIIYRWNRHYPSDVKLPLAELVKGRVLLSSTEFPGSSHEKITEEVYG